MFVTLNRETFKDYIKQKIIPVIAATTPQHENHDGYYRPSKWYTDREYTTRETMITSAYFTADLANNRLLLTLEFNNVPLN